MSDRADPLPHEAVILGIETSIRPGTIALNVYRSGRLTHHERREIETEGRRQAAAIVSVAKELCSTASLSLADVTAVGVSAGPGSFTGLRIGMTFAKTLAHANRVPLYSFSTMRVVADWHLLTRPGRCRVVIDAQSGFVFSQDWTRLDDEHDELTAVGPIRRVSAKEAEHGFDPSEIRRIPMPDRELGTIPHAGMIAVLTTFAVERDDEAESLDPVTAEPLYVRKSGAEEKAEPARKPEA